MPFAVATYDNPQPEPLLFAAGLDAIKSVVLDSSYVASVTTGSDTRRTLRAGTLLAKGPNNGPDGNPKYIPYTGSGTIEGVLEQNVDFLAAGPQGDTPAALLYHGCVFRASAIVDFSTYGAAAKTALTTCKFENV